MQSPASELNLDGHFGVAERPSRQKFSPIRFSEEKFIEPYQRKPKIRSKYELKEQIRKAIFLSEKKKQIKPAWLVLIEKELIKAGCIYTGLNTDKPFVLTPSSNKIFTCWEDLVRYEKLFPVLKEIYSQDMKNWPNLLLKYYDFFTCNFLFFELDMITFQNFVARYFYSFHKFSKALKNDLALEIIEDKSFSVDKFLAYWIYYTRDVHKVVCFLSIIFSRLPKQVKNQLRKFYPGVPESRIWKIHEKFRKIVKNCEDEPRITLVSEFHGENRLRFDIIRNNIRLNVVEAIRSAALDEVLMKLDATSLMKDELTELVRRRSFLCLPSLKIGVKNINCLKKYGVKRRNKPINGYHLKKQKLFLNDDSHFDKKEVDLIQSIMSHFEFC